MRSVNYLMSGPAHLPYLAVSLHTLRRWYAGKVVVHAYPESITAVRCLCSDARLNAEAKPWVPTYTGKNGQFFNKIQLMQTLDPAEVAMYLDADTIVVGSLENLFEWCEHGRREFVATQFCGWLATQPIIERRLHRLLEKSNNLPLEMSVAIRASLKDEIPALPSVNGGVFVCRPNSLILRQWQDWTDLVLDTFIADETVLHAVAADYFKIREYGIYQFSVAIGGMWNCSPKYQPRTLADNQVRIWHGHGDCFTREDKSPKGTALWWPEYQECLDKNIGNIMEWLPNVENKYLDDLCIRRLHE